MVRLPNEGDDEDKGDDPDSVVDLLPDGTHRYVEGRREGMLFRPYTNEEIRVLFEGDWECLRWEGEDAAVPRRAVYRRVGRQGNEAR